MFPPLSREPPVDLLWTEVVNTAAAKFEGSLRVCFRGEVPPQIVLLDFQRFHVRELTLLLALESFGSPELDVVTVVYLLLFQKDRKRHLLELVGGLFHLFWR